MLEQCAETRADLYHAVHVCWVPQHELVLTLSSTRLILQQGIVGVVYIMLNFPSSFER